MARLIKLKEGESVGQRINTDEHYPVRTGNSLTKLRKWAKWSEKNYPNQGKLIIIDNIANRRSEYWKMRMKAGYEERYTVYSKY